MSDYVSLQPSHSTRCKTTWLTPPETQRLPFPQQLLNPPPLPRGLTPPSTPVSSLPLSRDTVTRGYGSVTGHCHRRLRAAIVREHLLVHAFMKRVQISEYTSFTFRSCLHVPYPQRVQTIPIPAPPQASSDYIW